jgi:hypothetical protein
MSAVCRDSVEIVFLAFCLEEGSNINHISPAEVEQALSPARCPQLHEIHVQFSFYELAISEDDVRKRLSTLPSQWIVLLFRSTQRSDEDW